ncbi:MAG: hypothetical protein Q4C70_01525 [Planctomycetia bacterium]|nr:hypothetical protein [Planctomycetia bacterium]
MFNIFLYYGMKTVGKLFFLTGIVFLFVLWHILTGVAEAGEREFLMVFVAVSSVFAGGGALMIFASWFMKKPEIDENSPEIRNLARIIRWVLIVPMFMTVTSIIPLLAVFFLLVDMRDWRLWEDVPETAILQSSEETNIYSNDQPMRRCHFLLKTPQGDEITWEAYSPQNYDETSAIPLQKSGSLYRAQGTQFGILDCTSGLVGACMLFLNLVVFLLCVQGFWKLRRF